MANSAGVGGLPPLPKSLSGLLNFSRESLSRAEASLGFKSGILGSSPAASGGSSSRGADRGSSSSSSGYVSSSSTASPSVVAKENVAPITAPTTPAPPPLQQPQQLQQPTSGFQQYSSVKSDLRPSPSPSPFRPIQSPGPRAFQVLTCIVSCQGVVCLVSEPDKVLVGELNKWVSNPLGPGQTSALQMKDRTYGEYIS